MSFTSFSFANISNFAHFVFIHYIPNKFTILQIQSFSSFLFSFHITPLHSAFPSLRFPLSNHHVVFNHFINPHFIQLLLSLTVHISLLFCSLSTLFPLIHVPFTPFSLANTIPCTWFSSLRKLTFLFHSAAPLEGQHSSCFPLSFTPFHLITLPFTLFSLANTSRSVIFSSFISPPLHSVIPLKSHISLLSGSWFHIATLDIASLHSVVLGQYLSVHSLKFSITL